VRRQVGAYLDSDEQEVDLANNHVLEVISARAHN